MSIETKIIKANGLNFNVAIAGPEDGPLVLFVHGFPEIWYCWRHQIRVFADAGYRVIAPDLRGYGYSDAPEEIEKYNILNLVGDLVGLVQAVGHERTHLIGHDWGAALSWNAAMIRPEVFYTVACISVPFQPRRTGMKPIARMKEISQKRGIGENYMIRFQKPDIIEAEYEEDLDRSFRLIAHSSSGGVPQDEKFSPFIDPDKSMMEGMKTPELPEWMPQEDHQVFVKAYEHSGFRGPVHYYRNIDRNWELTAPWQEAKIHQPAFFITGSDDHVRAWGQVAEDNLEEYVPGLQEKVVIDGAGHWVQQEAPDEVNAALLRFHSQFR